MCFAVRGDLEDNAVPPGYHLPQEFEPSVGLPSFRSSRLGIDRNRHTLPANVNAMTALERATFNAPCYAHTPAVLCRSHRVDVFSLALGTFLQRYLWYFSYRSSNPVWQYRKPLSIQRYCNGSLRPQHV